MDDLRTLRAEFQEIKRALSQRPTTRQLVSIAAVGILTAIGATTALVWLAVNGG